MPSLHGLLCACTILLCFGCFAAHAADAQHNETLKACLTGDARRFYLAAIDDPGQFYQVTGNTSALTKYVGKEISVVGQTDNSTDPWPTFRVASVQQVFETPKPALSASFRDLSLWHHQTNERYGIKFVHPDALIDRSSSEPDMLRENFVSDENVITIARFEVPREVYPNTNFVGGEFGIFVNPEIKNAQSCEQFGQSDPRFRSADRVGGFEYAKTEGGGAAMGTNYIYQAFHTFQNGLCYEVAFRWGEANTGNYDIGCTIPVMTKDDERRLMEPLLASVSFVRPSIAVVRESSARPVPRVTRFEASSEIADDAINRGEIKFSWSTQDADYVELSYRCEPAPTQPTVVISEGGHQRECENSILRLYTDVAPNHSPNGSEKMLFGSFHQPDDLSIVITITPFSHGAAYPDASKSVTIQVHPHKPSPRREGQHNESRG